MNFKTPFKVLTTAALIGTLSLSAVAPGAASAAEKTTQVSQKEAEQNFSLDKVVLTKGDSKITISFTEYVLYAGSDKLNGYELAFVTAGNGEIFSKTDYALYFQTGDAPADVIERLSGADKAQAVEGIEEGTFDTEDGKLGPVTGDQAVEAAKAALVKEVAAAKATEIKDAAAKAELTKAIAAAEKVAAKEDATKEELEAAKAELTKAVAAAKKADAEAALEAKVESVTAINGSTLEIKFNKAVKESSVIESSGANAGTLVDGLLVVKPEVSGSSSIGTENAAKAELSEDGKTLTVYLGAKIDGKYTYQITKDVVTSKDGSEQFPEANGKFEIADTVKPTVESVKAVSKYTFEINLSEPVATSSTNGIDATLDDESVVTTPAPALSNNNKTITVTLDPAKATANQDITLVIPKLSDFAGNNASPITKTIQVSDADKTAPTVQSVVATSPTTVLVTLDEAATVDTSTANLILFNGTALTATNIAPVADDKTKTKFEVTVSSTTTVSDLTLKAGLFTDLAGNKTTKDYSKLVSFTEDKVAPEIEKQEVQYVSNTENKLVLTFSEKVTKELSSNFTFKYNDEYGVEKTVTVPAGNVSLDSTGKVATITLKDNAASTPVALPLDKEYTFEIAKGYFKDTFSNDLEKQTVSFKNTAAASTVKTKLKATIGTATTDVDGQYVAISFDKAVDPASATDVANYAVEGSTVKSVKLHANSNSGATVHVYLTPDTVKISGNYDVTVKNVKGYADNITANESTTKSVALKENVAAKFVSKTLTFTGSSTNTTKATLTFNELLNKDTLIETKVVYDVYIDGTKSTTITAAATAASAPAANSKSVEVTITKDLSEEIAAGKSVVLKPTAAYGLTDVVGNLASTDDITLN